MQGGQPPQPSGTNRPGGLAFISSSNDYVAHISIEGARHSISHAISLIIPHCLSSADRKDPSVHSNPAPRSAGDYGARATPVPIPNTVVKPRRADGTAGEARWESTSSPASSGNEAPGLYYREAGRFRVSAALPGRALPTSAEGPRPAREW